MEKETVGQGRYRKIQVHMWDDEKFRKLSSIPPCGQGLWLWLLTSPFTNQIPGLFRAGKAAIAEELGWSVKDFEKAFQEALDLGMVKADWEAKVVWFPNAINHNLPESPNVIVGWGKQWHLIPECALKNEAYEMLKARVSKLSSKYLEAFDKAIEKPSVKAIHQGSPNQEQEQEQDLNNITDRNIIPPSTKIEFGLFLNTGQEYFPIDTQIEEWKRLYPGISVEQELRTMRGWTISNPKQRKTKTGIERFITAWLARSQNKYRPKEIANALEGTIAAAKEAQEFLNGQG